MFFFLAWLLGVYFPNSVRLVKIGFYGCVFGMFATLFVLGTPTAMYAERNVVLCWSFVGDILGTRLI